MKVKKSTAKYEAEPALKANGIPSEKLKAEDNIGNGCSFQLYFNLYLCSRIRLSIIFYSSTTKSL